MLRGKIIVYNLNSRIRVADVKKVHLTGNGKEFAIKHHSTEVLMLLLPDINILYCLFIFVP